MVETPEDRPVVPHCQILRFCTRRLPRLTCVVYTNVEERTLSNLIDRIVTRSCVHDCSVTDLTQVLGFPLAVDDPVAFPSDDYALWNLCVEKSLKRSSAIETADIVRKT